MVKGVARTGTAITTNKLEAGCIHRNAKSQRIIIRAGQQWRTGIDGDFIGKRRQRRQNTRTAHDNAVFGFTYLAQRDFVAGLGRIAFGLVDRRLDDGVGQRDIAATQKFLIPDKIFRAFFIAIGTPLVGTSGEARVGHIHVIGRTAHDTNGILRRPLQSLVAPLQVFLGTRDHVADVDLFAGFRIRHQAIIGKRMLQIE